MLSSVSADLRIFQPFFSLNSSLEAKNHDNIQTYINVSRAISAIKAADYRRGVGEYLISCAYPVQMRTAYAMLAVGTHGTYQMHSIMSFCKILEFLRGRPRLFYFI